MMIRRLTMVAVAFAALLPACGALAGMPECSFYMQLCDIGEVTNVVEVKAADMREFGESESNGVQTLVWRGTRRLATALR